MEVQTECQIHKNQYPSARSPLSEMTQSRMSSMFQNIDQLTAIPWESWVKTECLATLTHFLIILSNIRGINLNFSLAGSI